MFAKTIPLFLLLICGCSLNIEAQSPIWETTGKQEMMSAYKNASLWFLNTPSYLFKLKYSSFKDHAAKDALETSKGYFKRVEGNYITEAAGIKTVQNSHLRIILDTADKTVTVMNPTNLSPGVSGAEEMDALLDAAKALRKAKHGNSLKYRIDFNQNDLYDAYEFSINSNGQLESLTYYYSERIEKDYDVKHMQEGREIKMKPRLEIIFFGYQTPASSVSSEFNPQSIVTSENGKIHLTSSYKDFRLLDYRVAAKQ